MTQTPRAAQAAPPAFGRSAPLPAQLGGAIDPINPPQCRATCGICNLGCMVGAPGHSGPHRCIVHLND